MPNFRYSTGIVQIGSRPHSEREIHKWDKYDVRDMTDFTFELYFAEFYFNYPTRPGNDIAGTRKVCNKLIGYRSEYRGP